MSYSLLSEQHAIWLSCELIEVLVLIAIYAVKEDFSVYVCSQ